MKRAVSIKSKYLIMFTLSLAFILIVVTAMDISQSRKELYNAKITEAVSLIQAVQKAGENVYISNREIENLVTDPDSLREFRKKIGIGTLFRNIGNMEEIKYLAIQDQDGIVVASKGVSELTSIEDDHFLIKALSDKRIDSREVDYDNINLLEVVKPFLVEGSTLGVIRIGISLESLDNMLRRSIVRSVIISVFLLLTGVIVFVLISGNQRYSILKDEYKRIQTYTGSILENMSDAVITADQNGRINLFNPAAEKIFELRNDDIIGKPCTELIKSPETLIDKTIREDKPIEYYEHIVTTHSSKQLIIGGATSIIRDNNGKLDTVIAVLRDLTAVKHNEELQKRREKLTAMGELAGSVAHEIKNPLNSIGITVQRFEKEFVPSADTEEYLELIRTVKSEIKRVTEIINQFLAFAKPPKINKQMVNVKEFLSGICRSYESQAAAAGVSLACSAEDVSWSLDYSKMKQVMINLIQNAFDSVKPGGKIIIESFVKAHTSNHIAMQSFNNTLIISVCDDGSGIKKEDLTRIFNLYFTTKINGTGLGLSIVNQIVQEHEGTIKVQSEENNGSEFIIEIPS